MHLFLKNPEKLGNTKTLRELVFRGANKELRDYEGMTPLDMFLKKDDEKFQEYGIRTQSEEILLEEVKDILGGQSCYIPCFHMKQPLQKQVAMKNSEPTSWHRVILS